MDNMVEYIMVIAIVIIGVGMVLVIGTPVVDKVKGNLEFRDSEDFLLTLDKTVKEVSNEGEGSSRIIKSSGGDFRINEKENLIEFYQRTSVFDYLTRKLNGNVIFIAGTDSKCYEKDMNNDGIIDLVMENSYLTVVLSKVNGTYNTAGNIIVMKNQNSSITPVDSSIIIDGNPSTSSGTGFSYLERVGNEIPKCRARFFMNSTIDYDIYYTLYSGADFLVVDVRNIG
ncbi:MAG: hypothetical protein HY831_05055 [Candidatus Aenigmarchaeota archaeon]|nr:hypothetical protein [Candidatus Aenigmarchaeota archaeon]